MRDVQVVRRQNGLEIQYQYDAAGRIARKTEQFNGASNVVEYAYDAEGRLTEGKFNAASAET